MNQHDRIKHVIEDMKRSDKTAQIGQCLSRLSLVDNSIILTVATNGRDILYNPDYIKSIHNSEVEFCLGNVGLHLLFDHASRRKGRAAQLWNYACDAVVNQYLVTEGIGIPPDGIYYPSWVTNDLTAEDVYEMLKADNSTVDQLLDQCINTRLPHNRLEVM